MKSIHTVSLLFACGLLAGCPDNDGPLEEAGEEIDEAADEVGDDIEDAAEEVEDEVDDANDRAATEQKRSQG